MRQLFFRADGNAKTGSGHIQRCLAIADAASEAGCMCTFVCADDSYVTLIEERGYACDVLHTDYRMMEAELDYLLPTLQRVRPDYVIVDSYFVTDAYLDALRTVSRVVYLDDAALVPYPADVLINYHLDAQIAAYRRLYGEAGEGEPYYLLGPDYVPLRKQFASLPKKRVIPVQHILFSAGGTDPEHCALRMADKLQQEELLTGAFQWHMIAGTLAEDTEELQFIAEHTPWLTVHVGVTKMAELMRGCDLAISASGSTLYELCACGIPTIAFVCADNQITGAEAFAAHGMMLSAGDCREGSSFESKVCMLTERLIGDDLLRRTLSRRAREAVDGLGAARIVEELIR